MISVNSTQQTGKLRLHKFLEAYPTQTTAWRTRDAEHTSHQPISPQKPPNTWKPRPCVYLYGRILPHTWAVGDNTSQSLPLKWMRRECFQTPFVRSGLSWCPSCMKTYKKENWRLIFSMNKDIKSSYRHVNHHIPWLRRVYPWNGKDGLICEFTVWCWSALVSLIHV